MSAKNQLPPQLENYFSFTGTLNIVLKIFGCKQHCVFILFLKISEYSESTGGKICTYQGQVHRHFIKKLMNICFKTIFFLCWKFKKKKKLLPQLEGLRDDQL